MIDGDTGKYPSTIMATIEVKVTFDGDSDN